MSEGHHALDACQTRIARVASGAVFHRARLCGACMDAHANLDRRRAPRFLMQCALCMNRRVGRIADRVKCGTEGVTDNLENKPILP